MSGLLREYALVPALPEEELESLQVVPVIGQELAGRMDLQSMNLVKGNQFIPPGLGTRKLVKLLGRRQEALGGRCVSLPLIISNVVPGNSLLAPLIRKQGVLGLDVRGGQIRTYQDFLCSGFSHLGWSSRVQGFLGRAVTAEAPAVNRKKEVGFMASGCVWLLNLRR